VRLARFALPEGTVVDCALAPVRLGEELFALLTVADVSEAVRFEERLLREARTQAIANLGDSVAHEIRNPLNSIHMNVQLLREGLSARPLDEPGLDRTAATVQREIKRLDGVVRDFVQFSRPPALRLDRGSINHVVRAALDVLDAQIREKKLRVRADLHSAKPVNMDRDRLQRAIYNVLLNAVQALPAGGEITCRSRDEERHCVLEISDNGPGLDPAKSSNIFQLFYTTKPGGTGLGLPIANRIVEEHGGRMAVASAPGQGATFAFFLPYEGPPPERERGPTAVPSAPGERGGA
jgi:signal transduction histidine kinase